MTEHKLTKEIVDKINVIKKLDDAAQHFAITEYCGNDPKKAEKAGDAWLKALRKLTVLVFGREPTDYEWHLVSCDV